MNVAAQRSKETPTQKIPETEQKRIKKPGEYKAFSSENKTGKTTNAQTPNKCPTNVQIPRHSSVVQATNVEHNSKAVISASIAAAKRGSTSTETNKGASLYERGLKKRETLEKMVKERENEIKTTELEGATFKPSINPNAKTLVRQPQNKKPEDRFMESLRATKEKLEKVQSAAAKNWKEKHPFKPNINKK